MGKLEVKGFECPSQESSKPRQGNVALFIDWENIYLTLRNDKKEIDVEPILRFCRTRGHIVMARAYIDTQGWNPYKLKKLYTLGLEAVSVPKWGYENGNGHSKSIGDTMIVCDAMESLYTRKDISTFVIATGDKDFIPLIRKIGEFRDEKEVAVIGVKSSTADALTEECIRVEGTYMYYADVCREYSSKGMES